MKGLEVIVGQSCSSFRVFAACIEGQFSILDESGYILVGKQVRTGGEESLDPWLYINLRTW